jgi:hypothetical protein
MDPGLAHWSGLRELEFRRQERAVSPLFTGVSQLRTGIIEMFTHAAAKKTLGPALRLVVARAVCLDSPHAAIDLVKAELLFELCCQELELRNVSERVVDLLRLRMDLVDGDVKMFVLLVAVSDRDVLVLAQPDERHCLANNCSEFCVAKPSVFRVKGDHHVIGLVPLRADVAILDQLHDGESQLRVFSSVETVEIAGHVPGASLAAFALEHVRDKS